MAQTTFAELGVPTALTDVLDAEGKTIAFPIQETTLPDTLAGYQLELATQGDQLIYTYDTQAERTGSADANFIKWINKCLAD